MTRIIAAIDIDDFAAPVLRTAVAVAGLFDAAVAALHVREDGAGSLRELAARAGVELRDAEGPPEQVIVAAADEPDVAALVLGVGGLGDHRPAGYTAIEVITRVPKPVVVVPAHVSDPMKLQRVLVPLEGTSESSRALAETIALADRYDLEILVLHVHAPEAVPAFSDHEHHERHAWDREFISRFVPIAHDRVSLIRRVGDPADDVVAVARAVDADLIALGWSQRLDPGRAQVVRETLASSDVPVLLVPTPPASRHGRAGRAVNEA